MTLLAFKTSLQLEKIKGKFPLLEHCDISHTQEKQKERQFFDSLHIIVLGTTKCQKEAADDWTHKAA